MFVLRQLRASLHRFWETWKRENVTELRKQQCYKHQSIPCVNDAVIVQDDLPRLFWLTTVIEQLHVGKDGFCRSPSVKLAKKCNVITTPALPN